MNLFKHLWVRALRRARDEYEDTQSDIVCASPVRRALIFAVLIYFLCAIGVGIYWSFFPSTPNINTLVQRQLALLKVPVSYASLAQGNLPKGVATTSALITSKSSCSPVNLCLTALTLTSGFILFNV